MPLKCPKCGEVLIGPVDLFYRDEDLRAHYICGGCGRGYSAKVEKTDSGWKVVKG